MEKIEITAVTFGIAQAAVEEAWAHAQEREQFGKPICAHQSVRHALAEDHDMQRHVRDIAGMPVAGGSSNIQRNNIANRLGLPT